MRSLLSILLIGVPVTLILCLVGLSNGMIADSQQRARGSGADIMVRGSNAKAMLTQSSATLPEQFIGFFEKQPHVVLAMGLVTHAIELPLYVNGVDLDRFSRMSGGLKYLQGGPFQGPNDVIIDHFYAEQRKKFVGDTIELINHPWRVCGVVEGGKLAHVLMPIKTLQELDSVGSKFSQVLLKLDDPANTDAVVNQLKAKLPDYPIFSMEEVTTQIQASVNSQGLSAFERQRNILDADVKAKFIERCDKHFAKTNRAPSRALARQFLKALGFEKSVRQMALHVNNWKRLRGLRIKTRQRRRDWLGFAGVGG